MKCCTCGRFFRHELGVSWKMVYSGHPPTPDHEIYQCKNCTLEYGPLEPQHGIKPECSTGVFNQGDF